MQVEFFSFRRKFRIEFSCKFFQESRKRRRAKYRKGRKASSIYRHTPKHNTSIVYIIYYSMDCGVEEGKTAKEDAHVALIIHFSYPQQCDCSVQSKAQKTTQAHATCMCIHTKLGCSNS